MDTIDVFGERPIDQMVEWCIKRMNDRFGLNYDPKIFVARYIEDASISSLLFLTVDDFVAMDMSPVYACAFHFVLHIDLPNITALDDPKFAPIFQKYSSALMEHPHFVQFFENLKIKDISDNLYTLSLPIKTDRKLEYAVFADKVDFRALHAAYAKPTFLTN